MASRAALVTGGSSRIGLAIARALGRDGYSVTLSRRPEKLEAAARGLEDEGIEVLSVAANMADEDGIKHVVQAHRDRFGRLDVLVNNAGIGIGSPVADTETKKLDLQLDVNLRASTSSRASASRCSSFEYGAEHRKALMINTASIAGSSVRAGSPPTSATKFGVVRLSQDFTASCPRTASRSPRCALASSPQR